MTLPITPKELLLFIKDQFTPGEKLPPKRDWVRFIYVGTGTYTRASKYAHLWGEPIVIIHSRGARTMGDIELFPEILFVLLISYPNESDRAIIESLTTKLERFLREKGVRTKYPNLHTHESYYSAMVRALARIFYI